MELRYYQAECINAFYQYFQTHAGKEGANPIAALPTGTGKSYVIAYWFQFVLKHWPWQRVLNLVHVKELIAQNYDELIELWPTAPAGIYSAGLKRREIRPITFAGIKSVVGRADLLGHIDIVLVDECHLLGPSDDAEYQELIRDLRRLNPKLKVMGLTATPYRLGQGLLTDPIWQGMKQVPPLFTDICYDITGLEAFNRLIAEGFLCKLRPKPTTTKIDVSNVATVGGEFNQSQVQAAVDRDEITFAAIRETMNYGHDRKHWLVFASGIQHCEHVAAMLDSQGIKSAVVHSKTNHKKRDEAVIDFKAGNIRALVNDRVFTTGFNFRPLDLICDLSPTCSPSKHVQKYGRGTRTFPGKVDCLVLDFAGNTVRCGPINDPMIPRKQTKGRKPGIGSGAPIKVCIHCETYNHVSARFCTHCQGQFPPPVVNINAEAGTEEIVRESRVEPIVIGQAPIYETFPVIDVRISKHHNKFSEKPPALRVIYECGPGQAFTDMVCFEHIGFASKRARDWWRNAADDQITEPPKSIDEAISRLASIRKATHLKVWVNCKAPQIIGYDYEGTAFGTKMKQWA